MRVDSSKLSLATNQLSDQSALRLIAFVGGNQLTGVEQMGKIITKQCLIKKWFLHREFNCSGSCSALSVSDCRSTIKRHKGPQ